MKLKIFILSLCVLWMSCSNNRVESQQPNTTKTSVTTPETRRCALDDSLINQYNLVDVETLNPNIRVKLRYSGINNFLHKDVYGCLAKAYLTPYAANKLAKAQELLTAKDSTLHLLVWDAIRPRSIQWKMWKILKMPLAQKVRYVSNPRNGSIHNYGCAVDLTICNEKGEVLDMGTDFDYFGAAAHIDAEGNLLINGTLNYIQVDNRKMLRKVMKEAGFTTISSEWWHFNALSRKAAAAKFAIVE